MATTFVEYKNYGFWAHDSFLEGILYLIVKELKASPLDDEWKYKIIDKWNYAYLSGFSGSIPIELEENLPDEENLKVVLDTLKLIIGKIETDDHYLSAEEMNKHFVGGRRMKWVEINKEGFIRTAQMTIDLLEGKLKTDASSPLTYLKFD
jgi:hypothetical protein